ncbi:MAG: hypothetical protein AAF709_17320 [Pseudomonadota bacterium]
MFFSNRRDSLWIWLFPILTMGVICLVWAGQVLGADPTGLAGAFQQAKFDAVVRSIRQRKLKSEEVHRFRVDGDFSHGSLKRLAGRLRRGAGRGVVWSQVSNDGALQVAIVTRDLGHRGQVGYVYSETELTVSSIVEIGREWTVVRQVAPNWWMIVYRLG